MVSSNEKSDWGDCLVSEVQNPELDAFAKSEIGLLPPNVRLYYDCPWLARASVRSGKKELSHIPHRLTDLVLLVVSQETSCRYCTGASRFILKAFGYSEDDINTIESDIQASKVSAKEKVALDFARKLARANPRPISDIKKLQDAGYSSEEIAELTASISIIVMSTRVSSMLALPVGQIEALDKNIIVKMLRPAIGWFLKRKENHVAPRQLTDVELAGPCSDIIRCLNGTPAAAFFRTTIDEMMASEILPRRAKLLTIAVVAKALDCDFCVDETRASLLKDGFTSDELDTALSFLASEKFDKIEALLVPVARETAHFNRKIVQQKTATFARNVSQAELLEAVGVAALANALCRLSILKS